PVERVDDDALGRRVAGALDPNAVGKERQQAALADLAERLAVELARLGGELEVAGEEEATGRRVDLERGRVRDRVADRHELEPERAELEMAVGRDRVQVGEGGAL